MDFNNIAIHMFTEESRDEMDLEWKLKNPTS
jgi:ribosomal silencing factor RsfS